MSKAYQLESLKRMGIDVSNLGCVMIDVEMPDLYPYIPEEYEYYSPNKNNWWVKGVQDEGHVTLLYGLLPRLVTKEDVDEVLEGWSWEWSIFGYDIEAFLSPFPDEPYACIVARVDSPFLDDAHHRLSLLPHINTYPEFKPHVTLAYVKDNHMHEVIRNLKSLLDIEFEPKGLNYGDMAN